MKTIATISTPVGKGAIAVVRMSGDKALEIVSTLRRAGYRTDYPFKDASFGKQFKQADSLGAKFAVVVGEDEVSKGCAKAKRLSTGEETFVEFGDLVDFLAQS